MKSLVNANRKTERHYLSLTEKQAFKSDAVMNLEFAVNISEWGDEYITRGGGVLPPTVDKFRYGILGTVLLRPRNVLREDEWEETTGSAIEKLYQDFAVGMDYSVGNPAGAMVDPGEALKAFLLPEERVKQFMDKHFPLMGMHGNLSFATDKPLPGDTSMDFFTNTTLEKIRYNRQFRRAKTMYVHTIDAYYKHILDEKSPYS